MNNIEMKFVHYYPDNIPSVNSDQNREVNPWEEERVQELIHCFAVGGEIEADIKRGAITGIKTIRLGYENYERFLIENQNIPSTGSVSLIYSDDKTTIKFGIDPNAVITPPEKTNTIIENVAKPVYQLLERTVEVGLLNAVVVKYNLRGLPQDLTLSNILKQSLEERNRIHAEEVQKTKEKVGRAMSNIRTARAALSVIFLDKHPEGLANHQNGLTLNQFRKGLSNMLGLTPEEELEMLGPKNVLKKFLDDLGLGDIITYDRRPGEIGRYSLNPDMRFIGSAFSEAMLANSLRHNDIFDGILGEQQQTEQISDLTLPIRYQIIQLIRDNLIEGDKKSIGVNQIASQLGTSRKAVSYNLNTLSRLNVDYSALAPGEARLGIDPNSIPDTIPSITEKIDPMLLQDLHSVLLRLKSEDSQKIRSRWEVYQALGEKYHREDRKASNNFINRTLRNALFALGIVETGSGSEIKVSSPRRIIEITDIGNALLIIDIEKINELSSDVLDLSTNPEKSKRFWKMSWAIAGTRVEIFQAMQEQTNPSIDQTKKEISAYIAKTGGFVSSAGIIDYLEEVFLYRYTYDYLFENVLESLEKSELLESQLVNTEKFWIFKPCADIRRMFNRTSRGAIILYEAPATRPLEVNQAKYQASGGENIQSLYTEQPGLQKLEENLTLKLRVGDNPPSAFHQVYKTRGDVKDVILFVKPNFELYINQQGIMLGSNATIYFPVIIDSATASFTAACKRVEIEIPDSRKVVLDIAKQFAQLPPYTPATIEDRKLFTQYAFNLNTYKSTEEEIYRE